jgi:hypothetical protein
MFDPRGYFHGQHRASTAKLLHRAAIKAAGGIRQFKKLHRNR